MVARRASSDAARRPARGHHRAGDIGEVAVAFRASADHRIAEGNRVRLGPRHLLTEARPRIRQLVRRAGEGGPAAQGPICLHQQPPALGHLARVRATARDGGDPACPRSAWSGTLTRAWPSARRCDEIDGRLAVVEARIDMRPGDRDQAFGAKHLRSPDDQAMPPAPHPRHARRPASLARGRRAPGPCAQ